MKQPANQQDDQATAWYTRRSNAKRFRWHFSPEWIGVFSHDPWWSYTADGVPIEAAMWELFRRHPDAFEFFQNHHAGLVLTPQKLSIYAPYSSLPFFKSWEKLDVSNRKKWAAFLRLVEPQHGFRSAVVEFLDENRETGKYSNSSKLVGMLATQIHKSGRRIVIAIDPSARNIGEEVEKALQSRFASQRKLDKSKAHIDQWLSGIQEFEAKTLRAEKIGDHAFTKYRRLIETFKWPIGPGVS